jgi:hypothetical protein
MSARNQKVKRVTFKQLWMQGRKRREIVTVVWTVKENAGKWTAMVDWKLRGA